MVGIVLFLDVFTEVFRHSLNLNIIISNWSQLLNWFILFLLFLLAAHLDHFFPCPVVYRAASYFLIALTIIHVPSSYWYWEKTASCHEEPRKIIVRTSCMALFKQLFIIICSLNLIVKSFIGLIDGLKVLLMFRSPIWMVLTDNSHIRLSNFLLICILFNTQLLIKITFNIGHYSGRLCGWGHFFLWDRFLINFVNNLVPAGLLRTSTLVGREASPGPLLLSQTDAFGAVNTTYTRLVSWQKKDSL